MDMKRKRRTRLWWDNWGWGQREKMASALKHNVKQNYREENTYFSELSMLVDGWQCPGAESVKKGRSQFSQNKQTDRDTRDLLPESLT